MQLGPLLLVCTVLLVGQTMMFAFWPTEGELQMCEQHLIERGRYERVVGTEG
jgi:hypothetical protein